MIFLDNEITLQFCSGCNLSIYTKSLFVYGNNGWLRHFVISHMKFLGEKGIPKVTLTSSFVCNANCNRWVTIVVFAFVYNFFESLYFDLLSFVNCHKTSQQSKDTRNFVFSINVCCTITQIVCFFLYIIKTYRTHDDEVGNQWLPFKPVGLFLW